MATNAHLDVSEIKQQTLQLWEMFRDGHRSDIAESALQFFFARKTFENQPELIEHYRNKLVNVEEAEFIHSVIPNAQLEIVEDANHLLAVEKPREVLETIRAFLKEVKFSIVN